MFSWNSTRQLVSSQIMSEIHETQKSCMLAHICEITWLQLNLAMEWRPHQMKENTNRNRKRVCIHVCIIQKRVRSPGVLYQIRLEQRRVKGNWIPLLSHLLSSSSMRTVPNTWYKYKYMIQIQIHVNTDTWSLYSIAWVWGWCQI